MAAAKRFFYKAMGENGDPDKIMMDKSGANKAASKRLTLALPYRSWCDK